MGDLIEQEGEPGVGELFEGLLREPAPERGPAPTPARRRRRWLFVLAGALALVLVGAGAGWFAVRQAVSSYDRNIQRFGDPFAAIPRTQRATPDAAAAGAMNVLLLGSDSRIDAGNAQQWSYGAQRT